VIWPPGREVDAGLAFLVVQSTKTTNTTDVGSGVLIERNTYRNDNPQLATIPNTYRDVTFEVSKRAIFLLFGRFPVGRDGGPWPGEPRLQWTVRGPARLTDHINGLYLAPADLGAVISAFAFNRYQLELYTVH